MIKGASFADSLRPHERVFGELFINMIAVGETTGKLALVLTLLARQIKKDRDLRRRVQSALIYPAIIVLALTGVGVLMMLYVIPSLSQTIKELGVPLPWTTQLVIAISDILVNYTLFVGAAALLASFAAWRLVKTSRGARVFDAISLRLPIFGPLIKKYNLARLSRPLSYLITAGIPIVRSLEITASVGGNTFFRQALKDASRDIQQGSALHTIFSRHTKLFPPLVIQMIGVGVETGKSASLLFRLALFFEEEVGNTTKNFSTIIEPLLMIVIGIIVAFFAVSMLQPIYSSLGNIQ